jgi:PAS domain S-box-containing protein
MRPTLTRLFATGLVIFLLLPGGAPRAETGATPPVLAGSELDYRPFALVTPEGQADGFSVELLRAVLQTMGRPVEFKVGPWHTVKDDLVQGRIQVLPMVARTAHREAYFDFTVPYYTMHGAIFVRRGETRIHHAADLLGREVIVMKADIGEEYVRDHDLTTKVFTTDTVEAALRQLAAGQHDAVVVQKLVGESMIQSMALPLEAVGEPLTDYQSFCFAVHENDRDLLATLNEGLAIVIANGTYSRLREKWLAPVEPPRAVPVRPIAIVAVVTLMLAWGVAWLWQGSLRRQVTSRTAALTQANDKLAREIAEHQRTEQALRRTSEELEAIFANVHTHIAVLDREFNFLRINAAYAAAIRRTPESVVGQNHFALFPHAENERVFRQVVSTGQAVSFSAKPFLHPDQPERGMTYWDWTVSPLKSAQGTVEGLLFVLVDVTEQEQQRRTAQEAQRRAQAELEQRVRERTAELEAANQELQAFSYSVSHDLRGPLRAINGFSHAVEEDCGPALGATGLGHLARIREASVRMSSLIDGLLKLSQVFRSELQFSEVNLSAIAGDVVRLLREAEPSRDVDIQIAPGLTTTGDPTLLRVVLENLIGNAWKFTARCERGSITFGCERRDGRQIYFVQDNGVGFDMAYAHKLFQPFERLHGQEGFSGTGIGLATVRRVIVRHGGAIWAASEPDMGATFFFVLQEYGQSALPRGA